MRSHRVAVGAGLRDEEDIALFAAWQRTVAPELVAALADRADDGAGRLGRLPEPREVDDLVPRAVERRANQGIHAGRDADIALVALSFRLRDACEEHARLRDEVAAWLEPQLEGRVRGPEFGESRVEGAQVERRLSRPLGHPEPAAEVQDPDTRESRRMSREHAGRL